MSASNRLRAPSPELPAADTHGPAAEHFPPSAQVPRPQVPRPRKATSTAAPSAWENENDQPTLIADANLALDAAASWGAEGDESATVVSKPSVKLLALTHPGLAAFADLPSIAPPPSVSGVRVRSAQPELAPRARSAKTTLLPVLVAGTAFLLTILLTVVVTLALLR